MPAKTYLESVFGHWEIAGSEAGITSIRLVDEIPTIELTEDIPSPLLRAAFQLREYFERERETFDLPIDLSGHPEFYQKVWEELRRVPFGHTTSYLALALKLGDRKAVRAVGQAARNNPIAIVVPCHRCIALNGNLQGYFYGLEFKERLLAHENPMSFARQGELFPD